MKPTKQTGLMAIPSILPKQKKFYSDKEIYQKDCLDMKCSTEDMLLFACNPIYPSNVSESAIPGQDLQEAKRWNDMARKAEQKQ